MDLSRDSGMLQEEQRPDDRHPAVPEAEPEVVRAGWHQVRAQFLRRQYPRQLDDMERGLAEDMTEERWASVKALQEGREDEDKTTEDLIG